jgi:hypothetical protein
MHRWQRAQVGPGGPTRDGRLTLRSPAGTDVAGGGERTPHARPFPLRRSGGASVTQAASLESGRRLRTGRDLGRTLRLRWP